MNRKKDDPIFSSVRIDRSSRELLLDAMDETSDQTHHKDEQRANRVTRRIEALTVRITQSKGISTLISVPMRNISTVTILGEKVRPNE